MWGMVWETEDSVADVKVFYAAEFRKLGWTVVASGSFNGSYTVIFNEENNPSRGGMLGIFPASGVTKISLAWTQA